MGSSKSDVLSILYKTYATDFDSTKAVEASLATSSFVLFPLNWDFLILIVYSKSVFKSFSCLKNFHEFCLHK